MATTKSYRDRVEKAISKSYEEKGNSIGRQFKALYLFEALIYSILDLSHSVNNIPGDRVILLEDEDERRISE